MALTYKTGASSWQAGWTISPTRLDDGIIDSTAGGGPFSPGNTLPLGSLWVQSSAAGSISVTSPTPGGYATVMYNRGTQPSGYTVYVSDNKTINIQLQIAFDGGANGSPNQSVYVGTNGFLNANTSAVTSSVNVSKYGPGTWRLAASENGNTATASGPSTLTIYEGTCLTGSGAGNALGTGGLVFAGGKLTVGVSRTFANAITMTGNGTLRSEGTAVATMTVGASGAGTLTIERSGSGSITFNPSLTISCPVSVSSGGLLTIGASTALSGDLSGVGTVTCQGVWTNTLSGNASGFTGAVTGSFVLSGTGKTFAGNVANACDFVSGSEWTFTGVSSGVMNALNSTTATVTGSFEGSGATYLINTNPRLNLVGPSPALGTLRSGLTVQIGLGGQPAPAAIVTLNNGALLASPITENSSSDVLTLGVEDTSSCTHSGNITANTSATPLKIRSKGTLTMSGTVSGGAAARTISLNSDSGYTNTIKITGAGFATSSPVTLSQGKLYLNRAGTISIGGSTGLTVSNGATVGCVSTGAYAAQLSGAMVLNSGSTLKFGAAP